MATIVAIDCADGVLLAGDRTVVRDGAAVGSRRHVFDFDGVAAAAVGDEPDAFRRRLGASLRGYATERGMPTVAAVARMAADIVDETGVEAIVVAGDDDGRARIRSVVDGALEERVVALGSAAAVVLGQLDDRGEVPLEEASFEGAESLVERAFRTAASRDPGTGGDIDVLLVDDAEAPGKRFSPRRGNE